MRTSAIGTEDNLQQRNSEAERLGGLEIVDQQEFRRLLSGEVGRTGEDAVEQDAAFACRSTESHQ